jgi:copper homeostasis protein
MSAVPEPRLEVCVESLEAALEAQAAGADRIELCSRLDLDGLSPGPELLRSVLARISIPVHVMVRPEAGFFSADAARLERMLAEVAAAREAGAAGVVLGLLAPDGGIERAACARLVAAARPLAVTFHRAFDRVADPSVALEALVELGIERVLTSGGAARAAQGVEALRALVEAAAGRIVVIAAGGVRDENRRALVQATGVTEVHGSRPFRRASG